MKKIRLKAYGKLNLGLDVIGKRNDGYHELSMVMQTVKLYDTIELHALDMPLPGTDGIRLSCDKKGLSTDENNIVYKAIKLMKQEFNIKDPVDAVLTKHIPVAAGMAGGSADAAATLIAMNYLFSLKASKEKLCELGLLLGADVPFCVMRGTMLCEGIGEKMTRLPEPPYCHILIAKPMKGISTKEIYEAADSLPDPYHPDIKAIIKALTDKDLAALAKNCGNTLEAVTAARLPVIQRIEEIMLSNGALTAVMTGSGPTVFGLFTDRNAARLAGKKIRNKAAGEAMDQVSLTEWFK